jgi:Bacterial Ig-like domain (group 3)
LVSDPCSIEIAINDASTAMSDDVTLLGGLPPAPYVTATPLVVPSNVTVHGGIGARAVIQADGNGTAPGVKLSAGSVLRDVVVDFDGPNEAAVQLVGGGTIERITARATGGSSAGGCGTLDGGTMVIRDSVCWHDGAATPNPVGGVTARNGTVNAQTLTLRNVTAISSDENNEAGIFAIQSGGGALTVNATNTIAFSENGSDVAHLAGFTPTAVNLDHSNFNSESDTGNVITNPGTGSPNFNQTTPPEFVDRLGGDFHQLPTSAGTIDLGAASLLIGELDFDGHPRTIGAFPDIGADEIRRLTSTTVACTPPSLTLGTGSTTCTATVTDTGSSPTNPTGNVSFTSNGSGNFSGGGSCAPTGNAGQPSCQVTYTPTTAGTGSHQITASYPGDSTHEPSQGSTTVGVQAPAGPGTIPGLTSPGFNLKAAIKKCKKKFPKGPKRKKCIKRAKKRAQA